ncbi:hypothetical protein EON83_18080 [bacterium]|nr:MAG: hypothetical protein EON83_18080 [bacterium]
MKHVSLLLSTATFLVSLTVAYAAPSDYFRLSIIDADTGRGVPLVEVETTSKERFVTDSNGLVAINAPDVMNQNTYFTVKSHGYQMDADIFGNRGLTLEVKAGGNGQIKLKRLNIAERLYRITGAGIYRDSVLLGDKPPLTHPVLNGGVTGQDTVMATPYKGKIYWFWGDTNRAGYPLGNFATSGATSKLPERGGLTPDKGIDLNYWTDENGFSKKMIPLPGPNGPVRVGGVFTLTTDGKEQLFTHYAHLDGSGILAERGLALFNDDKALFEKVFAFNGPLTPDGQPLRITIKGVPYLYFQSPSLEAVPLVRVQADKAHVLDPLAYEAFTPLKEGTQQVGDTQAFERDAAGRLVYGWKRNTAIVGFGERDKAIKANSLKAEESSIQLRDIETGMPIQSHGGSVYWNPYRKRWVMISGQAFGTPSYLGELWFAEADTPIGPWVYARKIVTHNKYTFYNPTQHPFFDQEGGRLIYFEGTYTTTYSGNDNPTPLYDYNQMMYRLDLADARLTLPAPVYSLNGVQGAIDYAMREEVESQKRWTQIQSAAFFAIPPTLRHEGLIPIFRTATSQLTAQAPNQGKPLFYALPATPAPDEKSTPSVRPLYAYRDENTGRWRYSTDATRTSATEKRSEQPLCRVWRNPSTMLALDYEAQPAL